MPHFVGEYANLTGDQIADRAAIRPAMNLTTKYANNCIISRISAAVGGKPVGGLQPIGTYDGNEWKLTLLDRSRDCGILAAPVSTTNYGGDIKIGYVHAPTGPNEYIAVEIMDDDLNPIYYGRSTESLSEASGTATIPVAAGLAPGEYTLLIFNEQYNGDYKTDLRSGYVSVTLTVKEATTYPVTYAPGKDGTGDEFTDNKIEGIDLTLSSRKFTRDGYVQTGWTTIDGGEKDFNFGDIYSKDEAITLYPVWERVYDLKVNGITVTEGNKDDVLGDGKKQITFEYSEYTDEYGFPVRKGTLTLNGVDLSIDSDQLIYCGKRDIDLLEIVLVGENKLSAKSDTIQIWCSALSFRGSGSLSVKAANGDAIRCSNGLLYVEDGDISVEGSHAFAVYYEDIYIGVTGGTLTLIGSDTAISNPRASLTIKLGDYGVMLTGEATDGSDAVVTDTGSTGKITQSKYIRIFDKNVPITYNPGTNGTGEEYRENKTYGTDYSLKSDTIFTRTGYTLIGWAIADGGEKVYELGGTYSGNEPLTLYPVWTINQYTITFDTAGGTTVDSITQDYGTAITAPANPSKTGYTFIGWDTAIPATMPAENLTITARWSLNTYTITYDLDGGTAEGNPDFYTIESPEITLNAPTRPGYIFTGWSGTGLTGEENLTVTILAGSTGDRSYTAHWRFDVSTIIAALEPRPRTDFRDVSRGDWFYYDVRYVCENGLMNGTSKNLFSPYGTATRGMLVTILYRLENEPRCFGGVTFPDVMPGAYYEKAVIWASQNGIVSGYADGTFRPDESVTREQLAAILYRYTRYRGLDVSAGETASLTGYADVHAISDYALPAMRWACAAGILQGSNGRLQPTGLATRAQLAAMLHRYLTK